MRPIIRTLLFAYLLATIAGAASLSAEENALSWDTTEQSFDADFDQAKIEATYTFVNNSVHAVTITKTSASCGCTVPSLEKDTYAPGESGELKAIFTVGALQGHQSKTITVKTEADGAEQTYQLRLEVEIPIPVALKPRVRFWNVGAPSSPQTIEVVFHEKRPFRITGIATRESAAEDAFTHTIETIRENQEYRITLTPKSMDGPSRSVYYLVAENDPKAALASFPIYAYVR